MLATAPCPLVAKQNVSSEYAFVVFDGPESVLYAMRVLTGTSLFGQKIVVWDWKMFKKFVKKGNARRPDVTKLLYGT